MRVYCSKRKKLSSLPLIIQKGSFIDCFLLASWAFRKLGTNIKCICFESWIWVSGITIMLRHLFALSSFREPLATLASLNRKWFRADLTFRDPCAKYFLRSDVFLLLAFRAFPPAPLLYGSLHGSTAGTKPVCNVYPTVKSICKLRMRSCLARSNVARETYISDETIPAMAITRLLFLRRWLSKNRIINHFFIFFAHPNNFYVISYI